MPLPLTQQDEADILRELNQGKSGATSPTDGYEKYILMLGNALTKKYREEIVNTTRKDGSRELAQSVKPVIKGANLEIHANYYFKFVDDGVSGYGSPIKSIKGLVTNGAYRFKSNKVSRDFLSKMTDYVGSNISDQFAIAVSIKQKGISPHNINDAVISDKALEQISSDLSTILGLTVGVVFEKATNETT